MVKFIHLEGLRWPYCMRGWSHFVGSAFCSAVCQVAYFPGGCEFVDTKLREAGLRKGSVQ